MTGDESAPAPEPFEYLERVQWQAFRRACATMRLHDALQRRIWAFQAPKVEALGWFPDEGGSADLTRYLSRLGAECAVYVRESTGPWPPTRARGGGGRLVVAAAVWPRVGLSGLRIAAYGRDRSLEEVDTDGVRLEDTHLDVPWLRACLPGPDQPPLRVVERWRRAATARFDWL
ncbi:hypothetical protein ACIQWR_14465 [Streptomyces sp. NPDC098789]|uniref:hypothetical protein n=1 Tax=Streptomyces sp. NPDC098789 TaxID=3366098 RepID=UPI0037F65D35